MPHSDLYTWKEGHKLVLMIYKITNTSNIAEGFSRQGIKEKIQFYLMAKGSLTEIQNQLYIARDVKYVSVTDFGLVWNQTITVHKLITGLIKSVKSFNHRA